jgi:formylglycine-generating enzyme required for sulfatase activity
VVAVKKWSGVEVRALAEATRSAYADLAHTIGVTERMISKWVAGGASITPRQANQQALDMVLAGSTVDAKRRFIEATMGLLSIVYDDADVTVIGTVATAHPQARHPVDGRLMTLVEQGVYLSGSDGEPEWLAAFWIDVYPVTNNDYNRFVAATGHRRPQHWDPAGPPPAFANHPVTFVTWHDAAAYAAWAGKELPSAKQWEKAARGTKGAVYPWGDQETPFKANVREVRIGSTTPVDRYHSGASPFGIYDLCGNVWEWCSTPTAAGRYELKGSAFTSPFARAKPSAFNDADADMHDDDTGFRCVAHTDALQQS